MNEMLLEEWFTDMLDDCYFEVEIAGLSYSASVAFKRIDPIAYQVAMNDYESSLRTDFENHGSYLEIFEDELEEKIKCIRPMIHNPEFENTPNCPQCQCDAKLGEEE
jgi:hypothetical protein